MKLPTRRKSGDWYQDEREILSLLLSGDFAVLQKLRLQLYLPFCIEVQRLRIEAGCHVDLKYDANLFSQFTVGKHAWFALPAVAIKDRRFHSPLVCYTGVYHGIVSGMSAFCADNSEWPRSVKIHDWCYIDVPHDWRHADFTRKSVNLSNYVPREFLESPTGCVDRAIFPNPDKFWQPSTT